jgi:hypothetical protein
MRGNGAEGGRIQGEGLKYAMQHDGKPAETFDFSSVGLGQRNPQHCPNPGQEDPEPGGSDILGPPLSIREVAERLGCSAWTVRQRLIPSGLPHFRIGKAGKLMFFENQIVRWVLDRQREKGGVIR